MYKNIEVFAEVKTQSPFGYQSKSSWEDLFSVADKIGDTISIHTDPRWGGSFDLIKKAKDLTRKPILAKGVHESDSEITQAIKAGADWVLVVGRIPKVHEDKCIIEPNSLTELKEIPPKLRAVWNSRDLATGGNKAKTFSEARAIRKGWLCQASNISHLSDIHPDANAILVGTHLMEIAKQLEGSV